MFNQLYNLIKLLQKEHGKKWSVITRILRQVYDYKDINPQQLKLILLVCFSCQPKLALAIGDVLNLWEACIKHKFQNVPIGRWIESQYGKVLQPIQVNEVIIRKILCGMRRLYKLYARYKLKNERILRYCGKSIPKLFVSYSYSNDPQLPSHIKVLSQKLVEVLQVVFRHEGDEFIYDGLRALKKTATKYQVEDIFEHLLMIQIMRDVFYNRDQFYNDENEIPAAIYKDLCIQDFQNQEIKELLSSSLQEFKQNRIYQILLQNEALPFYNQYHEALMQTEEQKQFQIDLSSSKPEIKITQSSQIKKQVTIKQQQGLKTSRGRIKNGGQLFQAPFIRQFSIQIENDIMEDSEQEFNNFDQQKQKITMGVQPISRDQEAETKKIKQKLLKYLHKFKSQMNKLQVSQNDLQDVLIQINSLI